MKIAVVTPWFGKELQGGAEQLAFELAHGLARRGHEVEVLTTCSESFHSDWYANPRRCGVEQDGTLTIRRFPVDKANRSRFAQANGLILETRRSALKPGCAPFPEAAVRDFIQDNINSCRLAAHIRNNEADFDGFLFIPYLYGTTLQCWRLAPHKSILLPCLHDEPYAYLPYVTEMMHGVAAIAFNSVATRDLARTLYGPAILPRAFVTGAAITLPSDSPSSGAISNFVPENQRYALYLGRRSPEKNFDMLLRAYRGFRELAPSSNLQLVCAGPDKLPEALPPGVIDAGFVDEHEKVRLLRNAKFLVQPSVNESYSRVLMEAWRMGRPALVHARCAATSTAVRTTGGGWTAEDQQGWQQALLCLEGVDDDTLNATASQALEYAERYSNIESVVTNYESVLDRLRAGTLIHTPWRQAAALPAVHQYVTHLAYGSATSTTVLATRSEIASHGRESRIFAHRADPEYAALVDGDETDIPAGTCLIVYSENSHEAPDFKRMHGDVRTVAGLPLPIVDFDRWKILPDRVLMEGLQDGRKNFLFVGEIAEQNGQLEILQTFSHYLTIDFDARLILAGRVTDEAYHRRLMEEIARTGIPQRILVPGAVSEPALAAFYRTASVYCSLADGQAFGLPLVEAMCFNIPVCATRTAASQALLGNGGILVDDTSDRLRLAALWNVLATDEEIRKNVLRSQNERLKEFSPAATCARVERLVGQLA